MAASHGSDPGGRRHYRRSHSPHTLPSFPTLPGLASTTGLRGALAFLEGPVSEWTISDVLDWFQEHLVGPGIMKRPQIIREPGTAPVSLDPRTEPGRDLEGLMTKVRARVVAAVRGLIAPVADDRFLNAAIYGGRVRRASIAGRAAWLPSPREIDFLGDVVLSLVAADILLDREFYRAHLCVCDVCGRVSFKEGPQARNLCGVHKAAASGLYPRVR